MSSDPSAGTRRVEQCACGHLRGEHIYEEGACRPGFTCPRGCERFTPISAPADALDPVTEARRDLEAEIWDASERHPVNRSVVAAFESAVRAAERARLRGLVEGTKKEMLDQCTEKARYDNACPFCAAACAALDTILTLLDGAPK